MKRFYLRELKNVRFDGDNSYYLHDRENKNTTNSTHHYCIAFDLSAYEANNLINSTDQEIIEAYGLS